jgi:hypothetical protein
MGKRRSVHPMGPDVKSDEEEEEEPEETIAENEMHNSNNIQTRKKLTAKRRIVGTGDASTPSPFGGSLFSSNPSIFSGLKPLGSVSETTKETTSAAAPVTSVFAGFKGFSSLKSTTNGITEPLLKNNNLPSFKNTNESQLNGEKKIAMSFIPNTDNANKQVNKTISSTIIEEKVPSPSQQNETELTNISDKEINFMNELDSVYKKYYGKDGESDVDSHRSIPLDKIPSNLIDNITDLDEETKKRKKYAYLLSELNCHCAKWISEHVEESPLVILTPVFVDYFNYLIQLEKQFYPNTFKKKSEPTQDSNTKQSLSFFSTSKTATIPAIVPSNSANAPVSQTETTKPAISFFNSNQFGSNSNEL